MPAALLVPETPGLLGGSNKANPDQTCAPPVLGARGRGCEDTVPFNQARPSCADQPHNIDEETEAQRLIHPLKVHLHGQDGCKPRKCLSLTSVLSPLPPELVVWPICISLLLLKLP